MRVSVPVALALALAGCGKQAQAPDAQPSESPAVPAAVAPAKPAPALVEDQGEVQLESLAGVWRVIGVVPGKAAKFAADDPRIVGSLMDVFPEKVVWSYLPDKAFAPGDLCLGPVSGIIDNAEIAADARGSLAAALARLRVRAGQVSRPHQWLCGDGGSWGEDAAFQTIGEDRLAMRWPGDLTLVLQRIRRATSDPAPLPPTGAFQGR